MSEIDFESLLPDFVPLTNEIPLLLVRSRNGKSYKQPLCVGVPPKTKQFLFYTSNSPISDDQYIDGNRYSFSYPIVILPLFPLESKLTYNNICDLIMGVAGSQVNAFGSPTPIISTSTIENIENINIPLLKPIKPFKQDRLITHIPAIYLELFSMGMH